MGTILLVVNDDMVHEALYYYLTGLGHLVTVFTRGRQACTWLDTNRGDILVVDQHLRDLPGHEVARYAVTHDRIGRSVLMADMFWPTDVSGLDAVLSKPFTPDEFLAALKIDGAKS